jgi:hypothetical protein
MIKSLINDGSFFVLLGKIVTVEICVAAFPVFGNQTYANLPLVYRLFFCSFQPNLVVLN